MGTADHYVNMFIPLKVISEEDPKVAQRCDSDNVVGASVWVGVVAAMDWDTGVAMFLGCECYEFGFGGVSGEAIVM